MKKAILTLFVSIFFLFNSQNLLAGDSIPETPVPKVPLERPGGGNGARISAGEFIECYYFDGNVYFILSNKSTVLNVAITDLSTREEYCGVVTEVCREVYVGETVGTLFIRCEADDGCRYEGYLEL